MRRNDWEFDIKVLKINGKFVQFCPECNKPVKATNYWRSYTALKFHMKKKHDLPKYIKVKCPTCGEAFFGEWNKTIRRTQQHMLIHLLPDGRADQA